MTTYTAADAITAYQSGIAMIDVVDDEANVLANLAGLETIGAAHDLNSLTVSDGTPITLDGPTYDADFSALRVNGTYSVIVTAGLASEAGMFWAGDSHITSVAFLDSASNIGANLGNIHLLNGNVPYTITLTDGGTAHFNVSASDWDYNRSVFSAIQGSNFTVTVAAGVLASSVAGVANLSYLSSLTVSDSATDIGTNIDALEGAWKAGKLASLTMTSGTSTPIPITVAQIISDADVLALLPSGYTLSILSNAAGAAAAAALPHVDTVSVSDIGTALGANLNALQTLAAAGTLSAVTQTDYSLLTVTAAQVSTDAQALAKFNYYGLNEIVSAAAAGTAIYQSKVIQVDIVDTAANISANIATIASIANSGKVSSITDTDGGTIQVTDDQYNSQADWRYDLTGNYSIAITGVDFGAVTSRLYDSHVISIGILDPANYVADEMDNLELMAKSGKLSGISFTDSGTPVLSLTAAQITADADALALIDSPYSLSGAPAASATAAAAGSHVVKVSVSDTLANITANMSSLETLASAGKLGTVRVTDSATVTLTLNQSQWNAQQSVVTKMTSGSSTLNLVLLGLNAASAVSAEAAPVESITIVDSAANVVAELDQLEYLGAWGSLKSITFTDSTAPVLTLTAAQLANDANVISKIVSPYTLSGGAVTVAALAAQPSGSRGLNVVDYSQTIGSNLDLLETEVTAGIVSSIAFAGPAQFMTITQAQLSADKDALSAISGPYYLTLSGVTAGAASSALAQPHVNQVSVSDTATDISATLDTLQALWTANKLSSVTISDGHLVTVTQGQLTSDAVLINNLSQNSVILSGVSAANARSSTLIGHVAQVAVTDSVANVIANLDLLENLASGGRLASITLTDPGTPQLPLTEAQVASDSQAIHLITSPYILSTTGLTVAQFNAEIGSGQVAAGSIADSSSIVAADLDALAADVSAGKLTSIALTDGGTPTLSFSEAQYNKDGAALQVIVGAHQLLLSQVGAADAAALSAASNVASVGVSDTAANISANLDTLQSLLTSEKLTSLAVTDGGNLSVTAAQMTSDAQVINDIAGSYTLTVTDVSLSALTPTLVSHAASISVSDSAAHIASNLDALESYATAGKLTNATVTDTNFPALSIMAAQLTSDAAALKDLSGNFTLTIDASAGANLNLSGVAGHANAVSFSDPASDYAISAAPSGDTVIVTDTGTGRTSTDTLNGISAVQFGSQTDIVAQTPGQGHVTTGNVTELYSAVLGRLPDIAGLKFFEDVLQQQPNLPLQQFAQWFLASPEYTSNAAHDYAQSSAGDAQFITDCYENLLGRAPETGAIPYYQNVIDSFTNGLTAGTAAYTAALAVGHAYVLSYFSASPEFLGDVTITAQNPSSPQHWLLLTN